MHLLRWLRNKGRYDHIDGAVPEDRRRRDAQDLAAGHDAEFAEWDLLCPEKVGRRDWDEELPTRRSGEPLMTDDDSDGSGSETCPSMGSQDEFADATRALGDDQGWERMACGSRARDDHNAGVPFDVPAEDVAHLKDLEFLLQDPTWHPSAIPLEPKRCILAYNSRRARRMRRWWVARMTGKTNQHDRHAGPPVEVPPVYGDDTPSECSDISETESQSPTDENDKTAEDDSVSLVTWNSPGLGP